jgi:hypothetical protein
MREEMPSLIAGIGSKPALLKQLPSLGQPLDLDGVRGIARRDRGTYIAKKLREHIEASAHDTIQACSLQLKYAVIIP